MLDELDRNILNLLQENARTTISDIAQQVHLSVTAVARRMERLEDQGIIRNHRTQVDAGKIGMGVHGFLIGGVFHVMLKEFYAYIAAVPEIVRCETIISGGKEVLLEFYFRDVDALMDFYDSDIRNYLDSMTVYLVKNTPEKDSPLAL